MSEVGRLDAHCDSCGLVFLNTPVVVVLATGSSRRRILLLTSRSLT